MFRPHPACRHIPILSVSQPRPAWRFLWLPGPHVARVCSPLQRGSSTPFLLPHDAALLELQVVLTGSRLAGGLDAGRAGPAAVFWVPGPGPHAVPLPLVVMIPVLTWLWCQLVCSYQVTCGENSRTM